MTSAKTSLLVSPTRILQSPQSVLKDMQTLAQCTRLFGSLSALGGAHDTETYAEYVADDTSRFTDASLTQVNRQIPSSCQVFLRDGKLIVRLHKAFKRRYACWQTSVFVSLLLIVVAIWIAWWKHIPFPW
jgi:hypothetical protein